MLFLYFRQFVTYLNYKEKTLLISELVGFAACHFHKPVLYPLCTTNEKSENIVVDYQIITDFMRQK